jgi:hypothetical protein
MSSLLRGIACTLCCALLPATLPPLAASAQVIFVEGTVVDSTGRPVAGARVRVTGANVSLQKTTDAAGSFAFPTLTVGKYQLAVTKAGLAVDEPVEVTSSGVNVVVVLSKLKTIAVTAAASGNPVAKRSGTDLAINSGQLAHLPAGSSMPGILAQLPSAAMGSNGQVHINGDHNGLNYNIDGVQVPANLNRVVGNEIDPSDIGYLDVLEGAYPAQYGDKFAAVLNIGTKANAGPAGYNASIGGGSFGTYNGSYAAHMPVGSHGGSVSLAAYAGQDTWGIDPSVSNPVHNASSDTNEFLRLSLPVNASDTLNFDAIHSLQTFQIPPDTANGVPAATDDNEYQGDTFLALQYRHAIGDHGSLQFGPSFTASNILDTNDLANDLAAGGPPPPPGQINCIDFTNCIFSVFANRTARDYRFNLDYALKSSHHQIRAGGLYDAATVRKDYDITIQPFSALNPTGLFSTTDTAPNVGHQEEAYVQDSWAMGRNYELDYGLRQDAFQIFSTNFDRGYSQTSPRIKLTRFFGSRASVYAYYGRLFVPFSFENVNPATAASLYYAPPPDTFDLKPQRDSLYELGGHIPIGSEDVGIRIMHKVSTDWIDDTQIGATNLHQDINFPIGRVDVQTMYVQQNLPRSGRIYASVTHSLALNSAVCETNLLQNCTLGGYLNGPGSTLVPYYVSPGGGLTQADHDQHWDQNAGLLENDKHGGWLSINEEYGSGLSFGTPVVIVPPRSGRPAYAYASDPACVTLDAVNCKVPPHLVFNVEKGFSVGKNMTLDLSVVNLLDDRYAITLDNSLQGTHYARPQAFVVQLDAK